MKKDGEKTYKVKEVDEEERGDEEEREDEEGREDETTDCVGKSTNVQENGNILKGKEVS